MPNIILKLLPLPRSIAALGAARNRQRRCMRRWSNFASVIPAGPLPDDARDKFSSRRRRKTGCIPEDAEFLSLPLAAPVAGLDAVSRFRGGAASAHRAHLCRKGRPPDHSPRRRFEFDPHRQSRPHRIAQGWNGGVVDYKSGRRRPSKEVARRLVAATDTLEAAMLSSGAFRDVETREVSDSVLFAGRRRRGKAARARRGRKEAFRGTGRRALRRTLELLNDFRDPKQVAIRRGHSRNSPCATTPMTISPAPANGRPRAAKAGGDES